MLTQYANPVAKRYGPSLRQVGLGIRQTDSRDSRLWRPNFLGAKGPPPESGSARISFELELVVLR
jgi:hypothetical protein